MLFPEAFREVKEEREEGEEEEVRRVEEKGEVVAGLYTGLMLAGLVVKLAVVRWRTFLLLLLLLSSLLLIVLVVVAADETVDRIVFSERLLSRLRRFNAAGLTVGSADEYVGRTISISSSSSVV